MSAKTITQTLSFGVEFDGKNHVEFELRLFTAGDNIAALMEVGPENGMRLSCAMLARALVRLGDIPKDALTYAFLAENLVDDDFDVLMLAQSELKKKLRLSSASSSTIVKPSPSLESTATASDVSGA
ncbi:phage tail assembly protein [Achromobacter xylosoxidans]|uniref:phage tail assembly protein n=1 Tax=Alcaligenes xylosoxydans xylosoxydans TaxID=85698 RepID=UPI000B4954F2|nr:phage tail assembly protein [Achromobacter xylosoxidans]